ncbi:putative ribonuclease H-like domain-containing protein [Tanacetum coccineum]
MKKMYCLVVTDDFSRFTWVFFLATKDETSGILKSFITGIENLVDHKVKVIRCDNGTEFKNKEMNQFCEMKDHLGKFDGKADEGFFVRYSLNSIAFRVFNSRTRIVEENLHIKFSENTPNVVGTKASDNAEKEDNVNSTNTVNAAGTKEVNAIGGKTSIELLFDPNMPSLEDYSIFDCSRDDEDNGEEADMNNLDKQSNYTNKKDAKEFEGTWVLKNSNYRLKKRCMYVNHQDLRIQTFLIEYTRLKKLRYGIILAPRAWYETLSTYLLDNGFQRGEILDKTLFFKRHKVQQKKDGIFISQDKYVVEVLKKFRFTEVKTDSTPNGKITHKPLLQGMEDGEEVVVFLYRIFSKLGRKSSTGGIINTVLIVKMAMDCIFLVLGLEHFVGKAKDIVLEMMMEKLFGMELALITVTQLKFWSTVKAKTINGEVQLHALVDEEAFHKELGDSLVRDGTTTSSLEAEQDSGNITKTRSKETPNESSSLGTTSGGGPKYQETMGDTIAQSRFENVSKHSNDSLLARGQNENVVEEVVGAAQVSTAATTVTITTEEITLA